MHDLEIHEILGRDLDPIDDVRRRFELFWDRVMYATPTDGDKMSDDYFRIIDLVTQPGELDEEATGRLDRAITRMNDKTRLVRSYLTPMLLDAYNSVAEQVNTINATDHARAAISQMQSVATITAA
jgi:hypothetical protein